jgi:dTDP-4-dehydrorhamnose 3,5-epimerase
MKFAATQIPGAFIIEPERLEDDRGFFARMWCQREFAAQGLDTRLAQCSISFNVKKGTLRGLHYQAAPYEEVKLVRCTAGAIFDVIVDLRRDSPAFTKHTAVVLSAENRIMLYIPEGCAHGFQTLEDNTEVFYQMSEFYAPDHGRGVRWNDPAFGIAWPDDERTILERDQSYPDFVP